MLISTSSMSKHARRKTRLGEKTSKSNHFPKFSIFHSQLLNLRIFSGEGQLSTLTNRACRGGTLHFSHRTFHFVSVSAFSPQHMTFHFIPVSAFISQHFTLNSTFSILNLPLQHLHGFLKLVILRI